MENNKSLEFEMFDKTFIIQAYEEDDFVNLCPVNDKISSVRVDFKKNQISTWGKETKGWREFVKKINIDVLNLALKRWSSAAHDND